jgi:transcriptional regulator with XRE-family HTH domain
MATHHNLQLLCSKHGYTQQYLAMEFGLNQATYHRYHQGKRRVPEWVIQKAAELYKVPANAIKSDQPITLQHTPLSQNEKELYERLLAEKDKVIAADKDLIAEKDHIIMLQNRLLKHREQPPNDYTPNKKRAALKQVAVMTKRGGKQEKKRNCI